MPEHFIKFLTNEKDLVLDPFAGSCTTGEAAEKLRRCWMGFETHAPYLDGAKFRFEAAGLEESGEEAKESRTRSLQKQVELAL